MVITRCAYRKSNQTTKQKEFIENLLDNRLTYPSFLLEVDEIDNYPDSKNYSEQLSFNENNQKHNL